MKLLPIHIEKKMQEINLDQVKITEDRKVAIYKQTFVDTPNTERFEVIIVTSHDGYEVQGNYVEPSEVYPSNEMWGITGWTLFNLQQAEQKFIQVIQMLKERELANKND